ncbi:MAG: hypothetical protein UX87_C0020G0002 [Candidatus Amesbacteria bacterium GW2011_GWA1_47_16]|uniref:Dockerin domain-containing protein n=4 Tax=Candidatus Amesiibacteriota TaxID=1752730 RepID=A0A0G1V1D0_9BACT|nr:MAG: hypothetical protein UX87_C0020G0002 [Candidatus Amesbacteria bacterium GW2011_GWA1_47_16]KKU63780.1 MAG: hypothetical protein UX86_C0018G0016 [Candidatus Amesbacteria bacterium GW2011_GWC1_47_15]KKU97583.1 MAG: hypothetical protein UY28_C0018G0013 [Candidatus Amesbacteria bacterium GW2011_GWB1_48_13]OGC98725.1 MAG: hypothetical protein A2701_01395 [Candidatus Amesbacteria bacterium RIFCSPHIGHO2_01_FULL_47_34]OGC99781.1 MAG: hypothetical protein A2972_01490 [Candidatus Amesbacteria bact
MKQLFIATFILTALILPSTAKGYIKSASASYYFGTVLPAESEVYSKASEAAAKVKTAMGGEPAKAVLVITNSGFPAKIIEAVKNSFGTNILVAGTATGADKYQPLSIDFFAPPSTRQMVIIAIGGPSITSVSQADDGAMYGSGGDDAKIIEGAKLMAGKLNPDPAKKNLLLLLGPGHYDNNVQILTGITQAWGNPLPTYVTTLGMGSADGLAASIVNGSVKGSTINAILFTGNFNISSRGIGEGFGGDPVLVSKNLLSQIKTELGGGADVLFYVPGHPQVETGYTTIDPLIMYQNMKNSVTEVFGPVTLVGHHASSETGQKSTTSPAEAVKYHFFAVGIKAAFTITPTKTPTPIKSPTKTPTLPVSKPGDANGDGQVNGLDYLIWLAHYGQNVSGPTNGDFNNSGKADGADYLVWLSNYGL